MTGLIASLTVSSPKRQSSVNTDKYPGLSGFVTDEAAHAFADVATLGVGVAGR